MLRAEHSAGVHDTPWIFRNVWIPLKRKITYKSSYDYFFKAITVIAVAYSNGATGEESGSGSESASDDSGSGSGSDEEEEQ
jgi:hypothetical protein